MKLTKQQIDYAFERIDDIVRARIEAKAPPVIEDNSKPLTDAQKRKQVEDGTAKLKARVHSHTYWGDAFEFINPGYEAYQKKVKERHVKVEALKKAELKKAQKVKDRIMLSGDAEAALQLVETFAEEK